MWKDFFYFNKGEKRAIIILTILIALTQVVLWTNDYWMPLLPDNLTKTSMHQEALKKYQDSLPVKKEFTPRSGQISKLSVFDPNTADSASLVSLGLRPYVAKNILKYRRKGGTFRKAEDFSRIYGVDKEQYAKLKHYIRIDSVKHSAKGNQAAMPDLAFNAAAYSGASEKAVLPIPSTNPEKSTGNLTLDINKVDTTVLQQLKGVGAVTAKRILQYRNSLGGFHSVSQLQEIKGLYPETLSRLQTLLKIDTTQISKINANKASLEKLKAHPYLSFYQAKVIVELRKARSGIRKMEELAAFKEFSQEDIDRLRWYLCF